MRFEWDPGKDRANQKKHGLSFEETKELFASDDWLEIYDEEHSAEEDRFIAIGAIRAGVFVVVFTERQEDVIRILSARKGYEAGISPSPQVFRRHLWTMTFAS